MRLTVSLSSMLALAVVGLSCKKQAPADATDDGLTTAVTSAIDASVDPCTDFYQYACGAWLSTTEMPADRVWWGRAWSTISDRNEELLRGVLEAAAKDAAGDPVRAQLGAYYGACMDTAAIDARGVTPLQPQLARIDAVKTPAEFAAVVGELHAAGMNPLFDLWVDADFKDPNLTITHLYQGGLGLPDREYYLSADEPYVGYRAAYVAHVAAMLGFLGMEAEVAKTRAAAVLALETELARVSLPNDQLTDPETTYHRIERAGLVALSSGFDWAGYFTGLGYPDLQPINVATPDYFAALPGILAAAAPETLQAYLRYQLVTDFAGALPAEVEQANFAFYGQKLYGQPEMKPRWRRCLDATEEAMGEALGQAYVAAAFPAESKAEALTMIQGVESAFEAGLPALGWMDETTRARAIEKAKAVTNKVGYPDRWRDWSGLRLPPGDYFASVLSARRFNVKYVGDKIGGPVDRTEWGMPPQMVNAYYNPLNNEMVFPAGILQPPMFAGDYPRAMNYGGMGMIMGHELTHGFDSSGRKFAPDGRMMTWWDPAAEARFEEATTCVVQQYSSYEVVPGLQLNGELTLTENIADLGGIKAAYRAYQAWVAQTGGEPASVRGLSNEQLFFVAYAQSWCSLVRPETERVLALTDTHSPARYRVNGALTDTPEFGEAFACAVGTPMRPEKPCTVW